MKNKNIFFETPFCQKSVNKTYIDVSICKSNIKEETFYARPCKTGFVKSEELLSMLHHRAPYLDQTMMSVAFEQMSQLIVELIAKGKTIELFSLGNFSLGAKGKVEIEASEASYLQDENSDVETMEAESIEDFTSGGYYLDVSPIIKSKPTFTLKFEQSPLVKKALENMEVNVSIKKKIAPTITSITNIVPASASSHAELPTILRIKGEDLKVVKNIECGKENNINDAEEYDVEQCNAKVGVYIEESGSGCMHKVPEENILKNTPKELLIVLDEKLDPSKQYNLAIATQYVKMGRKRVGRLLRASKIAFSAEKIATERSSTCVSIKKQFIRYRKASVQPNYKALPSYLQLFFTMFLSMHKASQPFLRLSHAPSRKHQHQPLHNSHLAHQQETS